MRQAIHLGLILAGFVAYGVFAAYYTLPGDEEWGFVVYGQMAAAGEIRLYQDDMLGFRLPLPFWVNGLPQLATGKSLLAPRLVSLALGAAMLLVLFAAARRVADTTTAYLAVLLVATNGMLVAYCAQASYFALSALLITGGLLAISAGRPYVGMLAFGLLAVTRLHLVVLILPVWAYLAGQAATWRVRVILTLIAAAPGVAFLAASPEHWKVLAYVPGVSSLVAPRGYRALFALGADDLTADYGRWHWLITFARRYTLWGAATVVVALAWLRIGRPRPPQLVTFTGALCLWTVACSVVLIPRFATSVSVWAVTFAPLWALVIAWGASTALKRQVWLVAILALVFLVAPTKARHPSLPLTLPPTTLIAEYEAQAASLRALRGDAPVFLLADPIPAWLAGLRLCRRLSRSGCSCRRPISARSTGAASGAPPSWILGSVRPATR